MPTISNFYGIRIIMHLSEKHGPHFHAVYAGEEAQISIDNGQILNGKLRGRAYRLILEWITLHHDELMENWRRVHRGELPHDIAGLE